MPPRTPNQNAHRAAAPPQQPLIPFTAAAHEHSEPAFTAVTVTPGAAASQIGPLDVAAFGFIRHIVLEVVGTGGTLGAGVLHPDYPWNLFSSITLFDVNGAPIYGPLDGYASLWANIVGGYTYQQDPRRLPNFVGTINAAFALRIPVEISHESALGCLANQNAAAAYKVQLGVNPSTVLFTTAPTTIPTFTIKGWLEAWTLPNATDMGGRPQAQVPPAHGTSQYWSNFIRSAGVGNNTMLLPRVGNLIRNIICICRNNTANSPRDDTVFPSNPQLVWDARMLFNEDQFYRIQRSFEPIENLSARDAGVFIYAWNRTDQDRAGDDKPNLWLPTVQSSRLEIDGVVSTAGQIQFITNDIAPVEVIPADRFVETSASGFHPEVGVSGPAVQ